MPLNSAALPAMPARDWQRRALQHYADSGLKNFLAYVTPGAGKTYFALSAARQLVDQAEARKLVVVVHTHNLRLQWIDEAAKHGFTLAPEPTQNRDGFVVTFQQLGDETWQQRVHELVRGSRKTVGVIDEVHHAAETQAWGDGIRQAFRNCRKRILLSGTPFRQDEARIPFITYRSSVAQPSFTYGYDDALSDGIVAPIYFPTFGGKARWRFGEQEFYERDLDGLAKSTQDQHLNSLLSSGSWLRTILREANSRLNELRQHQPNAAGLVVARDQDHARRIHTLLKSAGSGIRLAVSDDNDAHDTIADFSESDDRWLVAVRMVSEGIDIPRLRVGVYASNIRTELFFRQTAGRLSRMLPEYEDQSTFMYLPHHPDIVTFAKSVGQARLGGLRPRETRRRAAAQRTQIRAFEALSATAITSGVVLPGSEFAAAELEHARNVRQRAGMNHLPLEVVASLLRASTESTA